MESLISVNLFQGRTFCNFLTVQTNATIVKLQMNCYCPVIYRRDWG